jgi:hypothetical protein
MKSREVSKRREMNERPTSPPAAAASGPAREGADHYPFQEIEAAWRDRWDELELFRQDLSDNDN